MGRFADWVRRRIKPRRVTDIIASTTSRRQYSVYVNQPDFFASPKVVPNVRIEDGAALQRRTSELVRHRLAIIQKPYLWILTLYVFVNTLLTVV